MSTQTIKPYKVKEYDSKQSKYLQCGKLPIRAVILGPSGTGKTIITKYDIRYLERLLRTVLYLFS